MLQAVASGTSKEKALAALSGVIGGAVSPAALLFYGSSSDGLLADEPHVLYGDSRSIAEQAASIAALGRRACAEGSLQIRPHTRCCPLTLIAVPVVSRGRPPEAICAMVEPGAEQPAEEVGGLLQLASIHLTLWHVLQTSRRAEREAEIFAAVLEILNKVAPSESIDHACAILAGELQPFLRCERVAVGVRGGNSGHCRLKALSGHAEFDKHADFARSIEAAFDETLLRGHIIVWPAPDQQQRQSARAHQQLADATGARSVLSSPLYGIDGCAIGAVLLLDPQDAAGGPDCERFLRASQLQVGACLQLLQRSRRGLWGRIAITREKRSRRRKTLFAALAAAALFAILCCPFPHRIACDCTLEPVVRRFVAAPYDGTLDRALVKPGDLVAQRQVLAVMDGREIRLELSELEAAHARALKLWESSLSGEDIAEAQQARLEMKRLQLKIQLLEERRRNLQIRSPLAGIVVSGDLEKAEGAPLSVGQTLFEIAPLDRMNTEVAIPEEDIAYVRSGMEVRIRLDAYPKELHTARIGNIVPRAESRDQSVVFVAETELDNSGRDLRPGMSGRATVSAAPRALAWLLFHKFCESVLMTFGW